MLSTSRHESLPTRIPVLPTSLEPLTQSSQLPQQQLQHSPTSGLEQPFGVTPTASSPDVNSSSSLHQPDPALTTIIAATEEHNVPTSNSPTESGPQLHAPSLAAQITPTLSILSITVLVQSGARHSFVLDRGYLERHSVKSNMGLLTDPLEMSVLQLKECIWKDWREDWDQRPASALFIKLIQFGAYLQDSYPLKECRLSDDSSNVIHMVIRPAEVGDDDMTQRSTKGAFGQSRERESSNGSAGCRCVIL